MPTCWLDTALRARGGFVVTLGSAATSSVLRRWMTLLTIWAGDSLPAPGATEKPWAFLNPVPRIAWGGPPAPWGLRYGAFCPLGAWSGRPPLLASVPPRVSRWYPWGIFFRAREDVTSASQSRE